MARVLVVDDSEDMRALVRAALEAAGHRVVGEAENGVVAIERASAVDPDAIVLDVMMPEMSGLEALPHLRLRVPYARIVMFTATPVIDLTDDADAHIVKGAPMIDLVHALEGAA